MSDGFTKEQARTVVDLLGALVQHARVSTQDIVDYSANDHLKHDSLERLEQCLSLLSKLDSLMKD